MNRLQTTIEGIRNFTAEVVSETRKTTWPEKQELVESTIVVLVFVLMLAFFVGVSDTILVKLLNILITPGR
jgi:preprotein translocase subunit SecE